MLKHISNFLHIFSLTPLWAVWANKDDILQKQLYGALKEWGIQEIKKDNPQNRREYFLIIYVEYIKNFSTQ